MQIVAGKRDCTLKALLACGEQIVCSEKPKPEIRSEERSGKEWQGPSGTDCACCVKVCEL